MLIDCGSCPIRGRACAECVVSVLFGDAGLVSDVEAVDPAEVVERRALELLIDAGFEVTVLSREEVRPGLRVVGPSRRRHAA